MAITLLDGGLGTELVARGAASAVTLADATARGGAGARVPPWSAASLVDAPEIVAAIHAEYAAAGATVHTANTFRTKRRSLGGAWEALAHRAVSLARSAVPRDHRVAGSIAPLEDCYRPDLSPADPRPEHRELARCLADAGVDLILCETFPNVGEALVAVEEAIATGIPTWVSFTAGPDATLLTPDEVAAGARAALDRGASAVLVNCIAATRLLPYVERLSDLGCPIGAYANAGAPEDGVGWNAEPSAAERYAALARLWIAAGATLVGGCCGTGPRHIAALHRLLE